MQVTSTVNGVDLDRLSGTIDAVTANPALARFQFRARNHWIDGAYSRTTIKDFYGAGQEDATRTEPFTVDNNQTKAVSTAIAATATAIPTASEGPPGRALST